MAEGKNLVGVDIGSSSIKVCQLREVRKGRRLVRLGYADLPPQTIVDGQVMDASAVVDTIQRVFREQRISQRDVAVSVSGQSVIIRKISVPMMTSAELAEQIHWEAEQHIPFDIKEVQVDYEVLRRRPEENQMDLLLVAAKKDQITEYVQLARDAKLRPIVCDIDAFTIQNAYDVFRKLPTDRTIALLNVGANLCSLNVVANGVTALTREIASGGNTITEEIRRQLSVPHDQAEAYKCGGAAASAMPGMVPQQVVAIVESTTDAIAAEIQRSLDFFMATNAESEISQIVLTGGTANLAPLAQAIETRSRVPVEPWSPAYELDIDRAVDREVLQRRGPQLTVALGLALRKDREAPH